METKSLHEQRYEEAKRRSYEEYNKKAEAQMAEEAMKQKSFLSGDASGKDLKIKPYVYYNPQDCIVHAIKDFGDQAFENISKIKATREANGQRLAIKKDYKNVIGEFPEEHKSNNGGLGDTVDTYTFVREFNGYLCQFEIVKAPIGFGKMKRSGYMVNKVSIFYFFKNGVGIGSELILKCAFFMIRKRAPDDENSAIMHLKNPINGKAIKKDFF